MIHVDMLICPYCKKSFKILTHLRKHVRSEHTDFCPVCNKKVDVYIHAHSYAKKGDKKHMLLWGLIGKHEKILRRKCTKKVFQLCRIKSKESE
ncbi:MAG: hypothetical protein LM593_05765 [Candidatus Verstraetearchaeota archaeon]|jgi:uncharacterized protein YbaR (Trm112 family)|nr:hypothetical protein [Candidatus Verstraetearchaeota archaeon]